MKVEEQLINFFVKEDINDKFTTLASVFSITVTHYEYVALENERRINYYHDDEYVGSVSLEVEQLNDELIFKKDSLKVKLITELGEVLGNYSPHTSLFTYLIPFNNNSPYDKLMGYLQFDDKNKNNNHIYNGVSAAIEAYNDNNVLCRVNFNYFDINGIFSIIKNYPNLKRVEYDIWNGIKINYKDGTNLTQINLPREKSTNGANNNYATLAECEFNGTKYLVPIPPIKPEIGTNAWQNAGMLDIHPLIEALELFSKDALEFIFETKDLFTICPLSGKTISLYSNLANICFSDDTKKAYLDFAQVEKDSKVLEKNRELIIKH